jgi:trans-2,3-dihydro-3-hydroxyanthranilate isomerase
MPGTLPFHVLDVFTDRPYAGNPLAVVEDAGGLSDAQMLAIAREFNLSETIFVMAPRDPAHDARVRIFFPTAEIPFAGHPTLGCAVHLAEARLGGGDWTARIVLEEEAGPVPVELTRRGGVTSGWFDAPVIPHAAPGTADPALCAAATGLAPDAIGQGAHRPAVWQGGPAFLYVPVADAAALARARPQEPAWSALMAAAQVDAAYLYVPGDPLRARMFSPTAGIPEDPATGSATAILAAQLLAAGALGEGETRLSLVQGVEMGRPSALGLSVTVAGGALVRVRVGGAAVPVSTGRLRPPPG